MAMVKVRNHSPSIKLNPADMLVEQTPYRFIVDGPYRKVEYRRLKPTFICTVCKYQDGHFEYQVSDPQLANDELISALDPRYFSVIPWSLVTAWSAGKLTNKQFVTEGIRVGINGKEMQHTKRLPRWQPESGSRK